MRIRALGLAAVLISGGILVACRPVVPPPPPPPPPPTTIPPPGGMALGWSAPGVDGPIATDSAHNAVWAMNKGAGLLKELNATTGAQMNSLAVPLNSAQHFPTPEVAGGWVIIERSNNQVVAFQTNNPTTTWTSPVLDGLVQARPLVVGSIVIVATENDSVYGLNLVDGTFAWTALTGDKVNIGAPEPLSDARLFPGLNGCGDIDPLGITSNPVLGSNGNVYAVGELAGNHATNTQPRHVLVAVDPSTGTVTLTPKNVDVGTMTNVAGEQQRAGLLAKNGNIYIGYGGLVGDCGAYHGYVVAASETTGLVVGSFEAAAVSNAAAVWGTSGPVADASGNVYASTGNSQGTSSSTPTDYSDGVVQLAPNMPAGSTVPADYFQPTVWRQDNAVDADLGSAGPVLLPNGTQIFIIGKQHTAFLLNTSSLGGTDHMTPVGALSACSGVALGQNAAISSSSVYVACSSGMQQITIG
jgi:hypothetical protein